MWKSEITTPCLTSEPDHIYMHFLENAPVNILQVKLYEGVAGNLVTHACKFSFQKGFDGFVSFTAKKTNISLSKNLRCLCIG